MEAKQIIHTFKDIDNWNGSFCGDYCIGCGSCDHFPERYSILCGSQMVKQINAYCDSCFRLQKESITADDSPFEIEIHNNEKCFECGNINVQHFIPLYYERLICSECSDHKNTLNTPNTPKRFRNILNTPKRFRDTNFHCPSCEKVFELQFQNNSNIFKKWHTINKSILVCNNCHYFDDTKLTEGFCNSFTCRGCNNFYDASCNIYNRKYSESGLICNKCAFISNPDDIKGDDFKCFICNIDFKVDFSNWTVNCEDISSIEEFKRHEFNFSIDGELTSQNVVQENKVNVINARTNIYIDNNFIEIDRRI